MTQPNTCYEESGVRSREFATHTSTQVTRNRHRTITTSTEARTQPRRTTHDECSQNEPVVSMSVRTCARVCAGVRGCAQVCAGVCARGQSHNTLLSFATLQAPLLVIRSAPSTSVSLLEVSTTTISHYVDSHDSHQPIEEPQQDC